MNLIEQIERYCPYNEQEEQDKAVILRFLENNPDAFDRNNRIAHMTASAWVVNRERTCANVGRRPAWSMCARWTGRSFLWRP